MILRGTVLFLSAREDFYCNRECAALHTLNTPTPELAGVAQ